MTAVERVVDFLRKQGSARTGQLATLLDMNPQDVDVLLCMPGNREQFVTCKVQRGDIYTNEYRLSSAGGRIAPVQMSHSSPPRAAAERAPVRAPSPATTPSPARPAAQPQENTMSFRDKIEAALKAHGPMNTRAMRKHGLRDATLSQHCADLLKRGVLKKLGGGPRSTIYGLPGQSLAEKTLKADEPKPRKAAPRKPRREKAPTPKPNGKGPHFGINEKGELGIDAGEKKVVLDANAFARLRAFIDRTKPVWQA